MRRKFSKSEVLDFVKSNNDIVASFKLIHKAHPECKFWAIPMSEGDSSLYVFCQYEDVELEELCSLVTDVYPTMYEEDPTNPRIPLILYDGLPNLIVTNLYDLNEVVN